MAATGLCSGLEVQMGTFGAVWGVIGGESSAPTAPRPISDIPDSPRQRGLELPWGGLICHLHVQVDNSRQELLVLLTGQI